MTLPQLSTQTSVYTDFQGLNELRRGARADSPEAMEQAAEQFEAMFLQMMLKSMREASSGSGLFDNDQSRLYQDLHDKQVALSLAEGGSGIGLAEMLVRQLRGQSGQGSGGESGTQTYSLPERGTFEWAPSSVSATTSRAEETRERPVSGPGDVEPVSFASPEAFIEYLWPHAEQAAEHLGTDPKALLAQAALETGWGKSVIRHPDGRSSHNLFNIKADSRWDGETAGTSTLEYREGVVSREHADFRSYDSFSESFSDYVAFLQSSPRYQEALGRAADPEAFVESLHEAGYATDPAYAEKIRDIMGRAELTSAGLKKAGRETLS